MLLGYGNVKQYKINGGNCVKLYLVFRPAKFTTMLLRSMWKFT